MSTLSATGLIAPPIDAATPHTAQLVVTAVTGILVLVSVLYALLMWNRRGTPLYLLILLGGGLAILNEPALDLVSQIYFPRNGSWTVFEAYGRTMPVWAVFSYIVFFGTQTVAILEVLRHGVTRTKIWLGVAGVWIFNIALEVTVLKTGIYFYFGHQPLRIGDFPAVWLTLNSVGVALAVAVFFAGREFFTGPRVLTAVAVPPACQVAALWLGTPHFLALNSDQPQAVKTLASAASIVIGLIVLDAIARVITRERPPSTSPPTETPWAAAAPSRAGM
jgi:hypothetical protein